MCKISCQRIEIWSIIKWGHIYAQALYTDNDIEEGSKLCSECFPDLWYPSCLLQSDFKIAQIADIRLLLAPAMASSGCSSLESEGSLERRPSLGPGTRHLEESRNILSLR